MKVDLRGGRLSDHRFMANLFRLYLHANALNLLIHLRNELPEPSDSSDATEPATWRLRLIKVAAEVVVSCRWVLIRLSSVWPSLPTWRVVLHTIQRC